MKRLKDYSDAPEARHGTLPKTYTHSKRKTRLHSTFPQEPEEREFVVDPGASMHMVSRKDLNSAELETMRIPKNPTTVMTANGEVQTREEATVYVRELECFLKKHQQFFLSGSSARIMGIHTTGPAVKIHFSSKMARDLVAIFQTMSHSKSLVYRRVPLQHPHLFLIQHLHHRILYLTSTDTPKMRSYGETRCIIPQKSKTIIKIKDAEKYKAI